MAWLIIPRSVSIVPNRSSSSVPTQRLGIDRTTSWSHVRSVVGKAEPVRGLIRPPGAVMGRGATCCRGATPMGPPLFLSLGTRHVGGCLLQKEHVDRWYARPGVGIERGQAPISEGALGPGWAARDEFVAVIRTHEQKKLAIMDVLVERDGA